MDGKEQEMVLLEIQKQLGKVDATTTAIKDDIAELKQKDISQSEALDKAYAKAKARQDSIRDDLQHQIDSNKTLILTINQSINDLNQNFMKVTSNLEKSMRIKIESIESNINTKIESIESNINTKIESVETRVSTLETKKEKALVKWWDKIIDKLVWIVVIAALVVLFKWLNAPPEIMNQLPH